MAQTPAQGDRKDGPAWYRFAIWDQDREIRGVRLRIPPKSIEIRQAIRSQVSQDLGGEPAVLEGGLGLSRWSMNGTHGSGMDGTLFVGPEGEVAGGLAARNALRDLFVTYATENSALSASGKPLHRLVMEILGGGPSEVKLERWWIQPDTVPLDQRSDDRPLAWSWSLGFWGLKRMDHRDIGAPAPDPAGYPLRDLASTSKKLADVEVKLAAVVQQAKTVAATKPGLWQRIKGIITKIRDLVGKVRSLRAMIATVLDGAKGYARMVIDLARTVSSAATGILRDIKHFISDIKDAVRYGLLDIRDDLRTTRYLAGAIVTSVRSNRPAVASAAAGKSVVTVQSGETLQAIAARELGDASRWKELAEINGLSWPFLDFTGIPQPGRVLTTGDELRLPFPVEAPALEDDPVGRDLNPFGGNDLVGGAVNLVEALNRRMRTPLGWIPWRPDYGSRLYLFAGRPLDIVTALDARFEAARTLLSDPRVLGIESLAVHASGDVLSVYSIVRSLLGPVEVAGAIA